jgi:hypothetical protein
MHVHKKVYMQVQQLAVVCMSPAWPVQKYKSRHSHLHEWLFITGQLHITSSKTLQHLHSEHRSIPDQSQALIQPAANLTQGCTILTKHIQPFSICSPHVSSHNASCSVPLGAKISHSCLFKEALLSPFVNFFYSAEHCTSVCHIKLQTFSTLLYPLKNWLTYQLLK